VVACLWEHEPAESHAQRILPDGCMDLIWLSERRLVIAGADTGPRLVELPGRLCSSGIRVRPGAGGGVFGIPAFELRDRRPAGRARARRRGSAGGWTFDWPGLSPGQAVEWRGIVTLEALSLLLTHGHIECPGHRAGAPDGP
jgi:hypothetical protein